MVYGCGNQLLKFLVFVTNLLIFIFGALICGFSLWANLDQNFANHLRDLAKKANIDDAFVEELAQYQASLWVLVAAGALLVIVGFLGCCGAACESLVLLTLFFIIVLVLSLIELGSLAYLLSNKSELLTSIHKMLMKVSETAESRKNLLPIEKLLKCCGGTIETVHQYVKDGLCVQELHDATDCYTVISEKLNSMGDVVVVIGVILLIIQFFSMIFSCVLCRAFRERTAYYA
jgi:hypothetical protein